MITRLPRQAVLRYLERLADDLTPRQAQRLAGLADLIDGDGRIPMADALEVATPGGGDAKAQDAFRKFRAAFDEAAAEADVGVRLVSDQRKAPPRDRVCWFEGEDLAGDELAARSRRGADRRRGDETVTGTVSEVLPPTAPEAGHGGGVIHVEVARKASDHVRRREREFVDLLSEQASATPGGYRITSLVAALLGTDLEGERRRLREASDLVVELDCAASRLDVHPGATTRRPLRIALEGVARGARPAPEIVHETSRPFSQQPDRRAKVAFVQRVLDVIAEVLQAPAAPGGPLEPEKWARGMVSRPQLGGEPVTSQVGETSLSSDALTEPASRRLGEPLPAVARLVTWATEPSPGARHLCALLGDVGMGKTTTAQLFTLALLDRREHDPTVPLPILFDLRDLPARVVRETAGLRQILQALLDAGDLGRVPTVDEVLGLVASGRCVLIFDGLDEVLVHLEPHAGQVFTRTLWRATEELWRSQPAESRADRPSKLLLSCRTHYFRSIRDEANHFTGQHRDGPTGTDYLALLMLPFGEEQVRAYLAANVPGADVDRLLDLIGSVHNLREIAERPLTLRMIAEQLETIEQAKLAGHTVRAVDLYGSFVRQWLERDDGKHSLIPDHKQLLMEHLAAQLWRSGRASWGVADVEQWMLEFLAGRPELQLHYPARAPALWKEDLRTATFLVRHNDDTFGFAHTSLREYFLARYLERALQLPPEQARASWQLAVPSPETLDFLGQLLARHDDRQKAQSRTALAAIATQPPDGRADAAAVLAFAYTLAAARAGHPDHTPAGRVLTGANLAGWRIDGGTRRLSLRGSSLAGANLTAAVIRDVDLAGTDLTAATLTRAEIHDSSLRDADLQRTELAGTIFRNCDLSAVRWTDSTAHYTQALFCTQPPDALRAGWLVAPTEAPHATHARLTSFTGHRGWVNGGVWSPDGSRILTASEDGSARVWDGVSGQELLAFAGHGDEVNGGAWSPDGLRVLTAGGDGVARVWDAVSGQELLILSGHDGRVWDVAWSPDGSRVLTAGADGSARMWDAVSGQELLILSGHDGRVWDVAWSPDGSRFLTVGADGSARVWDGVSGQKLLIFAGHGDGVNSGVWSSDGLRVLTAGGDGVARVWDAVSGQELLTFAGHSGRVWDAAWSPDGLRVLTAGADGVARVWDAVSGQELLILSGHDGPVWDVAWSPDGSRILTTGDDGSVRVWDAVSGQELPSFADSGYDGVTDG
ncbi:pentapeptide repeat-containing protein, partial [Parafrankia sp. EUN1f]|uniref:NACHT and WD40 repeat domain-containing protein n=1 Tax=Parafrankia sp. EUN1f TaxID=102897 RepID=UPI0001C452FF